MISRAPGQLAFDPLVAPAWVLNGQTQDEGHDFVVEGIDRGMTHAEGTSRTGRRARGASAAGSPA